MTDHQFATMQLVLSDRRSSGRLMVKLASFIQFDLDMNQAIEELEDRWHHCVVPTASRRSISSRMNALLPHPPRDE